MPAAAAKRRQRRAARGADAETTTWVPRSTSRPRPRQDGSRARPRSMYTAPGGATVRQFSLQRSPDAIGRDSVQYREGPEPRHGPDDVLAPEDAERLVDPPVVQVRDLGRLLAGVAEPERRPSLRILRRQAGLGELRDRCARPVGRRVQA